MSYIMRPLSRITEERQTLKGARLKLLGYWLQVEKEREAPMGEIKSRLEDISHRHSHNLMDVEVETGSSTNPIRVGLWTALRKLTCYKCPTKRMSFGVLNIEDFVAQALEPCNCGHAEGFDGLLVNGLKHLSSDPVKGSQLILFMAERGKHVINEDGICVSCCHPSTKVLLQKRRVLVAPKAV